MDTKQRRYSKNVKDYYDYRDDISPTLDALIRTIYDPPEPTNKDKSLYNLYVDDLYLQDIEAGREPPVMSGDSDLARLAQNAARKMSR